MKRLLVSTFLLIHLTLFCSTTLYQAIVDITSHEQQYDFGSPWNAPRIRKIGGSGFLIEGGYILTNAHVVSDASMVEVKAYNGRSSDVEIAAICHECDLALLKLDNPSILSGVSPLAISGRMAQLDEEVTVLGFPKGGDTLCVTKGRIIRIEMDFYVHSFSYLLVHQLDAKAFAGNSGGPVLSGDKVIGVLHQGTDLINDIIPVPVIQHFLTEARKGSVQGFPRSISYQSTANPALRNYYGIPSGTQGALVRFVPENHFMHGIVFPNDVILKIDGYDIDDDQKIALKQGIRVDLDYLITQKFYGETLDLRLLRDGNIFDLSVWIDPSKNGDNLVPTDRYDLPPTYYIIGGLVFQPLDFRYYEWFFFDRRDYSDRLDYYCWSGKVNDGRSEVVMVTQVIPDEVNRGYFAHPDMGVIVEVNGKKIGNMKELIEAFETNTGPFHHILTESDFEFILDRQLTEERSDKILKRSRISKDRSDDLD